MVTVNPSFKQAIDRIRAVFQSKVAKIVQCRVAILLWVRVSQAQLSRVIYQLRLTCSEQPRRLNLPNAPSPESPVMDKYGCAIAVPYLALKYVAA